MGYDPNEARDSGGKWTAGGAAASVRSGVKRGVDWVASGEAQKAIAGQITEDRVKTAIALGIKSSLYHIANFDDPMMSLVEDYIHMQVDVAKEHMSVTTGRARDLMREAVVRLMEARKSSK